MQSYQFLGCTSMRVRARWLHAAASDLLIRFRPVLSSVTTLEWRQAALPAQVEQKFNEQVLHMGLLELSVTLWAFAKAGHASPGVFQAAIPGIMRLCARLPSLLSLCDCQWTESCAAPLLRRPVSAPVLEAVPCTCEKP